MCTPLTLAECAISHSPDQAREGGQIGIDETEENGKKWTTRTFGNMKIKNDKETLVVPMTEQICSLDGKSYLSSLPEPSALEAILVYESRKAKSFQTDM